MEVSSMKMAQIILFTIVLFVLDIPFIKAIVPEYEKRWPYPLVHRDRIGIGMLGVYGFISLAITYVSLQTDNPLLTSFIIGTTAYASYAFTIYGIHPEWPMHLVLFETLWGGILTMTSTYVGSKVLEYLN